MSVLGQKTDLVGMSDSGGAKRTFGAMDEVREVPNPEVGKLQFHGPHGS
jgi:hypothetical protein